MKLYNTLSRSIEEVTCLSPQQIKLYTCGLTVYSQPHIGNWTGYIYWDVLVRTLREAGYDVIRTQNITDVGHLVSDDDSGEDKVEKGARQEGTTAWDVADKFIAIADHEAYDILDLVRPEHLVRATDYINQQIEFASQLYKTGYGYIIPGEGLYFDTSKTLEYGKLARLDTDGLDAGNRVSIEGKRNKTDFAIWKCSPVNQKRDMEWKSPWGKGFPGWHLECSVIARETLGDQIDIHTGGIDHIPVHHTNEIAQTEAITNKPFATYWIHNNHIKVDGGKMAKSLGNIYTLQDIIDRHYDIDAFKLMILSKHYRTEGNFTWEILDAAQNTLQNWNAWADLQFQDQKSVKFETAYKEAAASITDSLQNDLDTPHAVKIINNVVKQTLELETWDSAALHVLCKHIDGLLGLHLAKREDITEDQKQLLLDRQSARSDKDWAKSDEIRNTLLTINIGVRDTPSGSVWFRVSQ